MLAVEIDKFGFYIPGSDNPEYQGKETEAIIITPLPQGLFAPRWVGNWDGDKWVGGEWVEGQTNPPEENKTPDWVGLLEYVRATPVFAKVYAASKDSLPVNVAYTLLLATLTSTSPHINDLAFALHDLKANMVGLDTGDIEFINLVLAKYHFPISI